MSFDWKLLLAELVNAFVGIFGEAFRKWFEDMFKNPPQEELILVGDAPDELKDDLKKKLHSLVEKYLSGQPVIKRFALMFVNNLPMAFVDKIYDSIFATQIHNGVRAPANMVAGRVTVAAVAPITLSESELAFAKAEAGITV